MKNPPEMPSDGPLYLGAFWELDTCRPRAFGIGAIPWRDLHAYAESIGLDAMAEGMFRYLIRQLDQEYLEREKARQSDPKAKPTPAPISPTGRRMGDGRSRMKKTSG